MKINTLFPDLFKDKTKQALLWMNLLHEPFVTLYAVLPFILRKDLGASILQISLLSALRPTLPIFSFYWSAKITNRQHLLRRNLMGAWIIARIPFLFIPWIGSVWYLIFACAIYELFNKSGLPAIIQILKNNVPKGTREGFFTFCFVITFLESIGIGLLLASFGFLDRAPSLFPWVYTGAALLSLSSLIAQWQIPAKRTGVPTYQKRSPSEALIAPWKEAFSLLKNRPDFAQFQYGFMMGGFGLMLLAPSLAIFYADSLSLSFSSVITGRSVLMGIGVVASSHFWKESLKKKSVPFLTLLILLGFGMYPLLLLTAPHHIAGFYGAFILYGIAQSGSHLLWSLSGTLFSGEEDSSPFSRVNILMLGLRGAIAPALGGGLCHWYGPKVPFILSSLLCLSGACFVYLNKRKREALSTSSQKGESMNNMYLNFGKKEGARKVRKGYF